MVYDRRVTSGRRSSRYRVHLSVSYASASEFVREYAENLSAGGMFVVGAAGLSPLEEVQVAVSLPGYGTYKVLAEVCHVIPAEMARQINHAPGAGLQIKQAPDGFDQALSGYLMRLGQRADHTVLATSAEVREVIADAGYKVAPAPDAGGLVMTVARAESPVLAVLVRPGELAGYREAATAAGDPELVIACEGVREVDSVLAALDERL